MTVLEARGISKRFGGLLAVDDVTLDVEEGQIVGLIGPNGAGKTTCFHLIAGQLPVTSGSLTFEGRSITKSSPWTRARMGIGRTFQHTSLFPSLSVRENLEFALAANGTTKARLGARKIEEALSLTLPDGVADGPCSSLAYGIQRRVAIAVALVNAPRLLLLDEPAAGLNNRESAQLGEIIQTIARSGTAVLLVEHDLDLVAATSDVIHVLSAGRSIFVGTAREALANDAVIEAYIGRGRGDAAR